MTRRTRLSSSERAAILERQTPEGGKHPLCVGCGKPLMGAQNVQFDHRRSGLPRWFFDYEGSGVDPDDQDHQYAMHSRCHVKLYKQDAGMIAKTKGMSGQAGQRANRLTGASRRKIAQRPDPWR